MEEAYGRKRATSWLTSAKEMDGELNAGLLKRAAEALRANLSPGHSNTLTT